MHKSFVSPFRVLLDAFREARMMASSTIDETPPPLSGSCLVIGGNRGLGLEVVRHLKQRQSNVMATTRKTNADLEVTLLFFSPTSYIVVFVVHGALLVFILPYVQLPVFRRNHPALIMRGNAPRCLLYYKHCEAGLDQAFVLWRSTVAEPA